jgi:hypothetical protein
VVANTGTNVLTFTNINGIQVKNLTVGETSVRANFYIEDEGLSISVYRTNAETYIGNLGFTDNSVRLAVPVSFDNNTTAAQTRTNLGLGWSALTNTNAATQLLGVNTNGQVVYSGTNTLTFTNRVYQSSTNATNPPELRLTTRSNSVASWFVYDGNQTNTSPQSPDWTVSWLGINHVPSPNGLDRARTNFNVGAHSLTLENMWVSPVVNSPVSETYFNTEDTNGLTTRTFFIMGSQTNSEIGGIEMKYPVILTAKSNSIYWYGGNPQAAMSVFSDQEFLLRAENNTTNAGAVGRITFGTGTLGNTAFRSATNFSEARHFAIGTTIYRLTATGVIFGSGNANANAAQPIHLAGDTRVDGAISFNATTNADITRTNLGLGGGITTNRTFVSYNGTNYTTNSVTISNGIITGWTQ